MTTQWRKSEKEEMVVVGADVGVGSGADDLTLEKECLLAELDVERDEMRRRLLAFEMTRVGGSMLMEMMLRRNGRRKFVRNAVKRKSVLTKMLFPPEMGRQRNVLVTQGRAGRAMSG